MERSDIQVVLIKKNSEQSRKEISIKNMVIEYHIGKRKFKEKLDYLKRKKNNLEDNLENIVKQIEYYMENISIVKEQISNIYSRDVIQNSDEISFDTNKLFSYKQKIIDDNSIIKKLVISYEKVKDELTNTNETILVNSRDNTIKEHFTTASIVNISEELEKYENEINSIIKNSKIFI